MAENDSPSQSPEEVASFLRSADPLMSKRSDACKGVDPGGPGAIAGSTFHRTFGELSRVAEAPTLHLQWHPAFAG